MKYIFTLLSLLFLQNLSFNVIKPKLCLNCKYFITDNNTGKYGKCLLFPNEVENNYRLVNGNSLENKNEYHFCVVARKTENMCGIEGKRYKKKYIRKQNL